MESFGTFWNLLEASLPLTDDSFVEFGSPTFVVLNCPISRRVDWKDSECTGTK